MTPPMLSAIPQANGQPQPYAQQPPAMFTQQQPTYAAPTPAPPPQDAFGQKQQQHPGRSPIRF